MDIKKIVNKNLIILDCNLDTKEAVIEELVVLLENEKFISSKELFLKEVLEREKLSSTGLEKGIAIPHGKSKYVIEPKIAIARTKKPIKDWKSIDEKNEVNLVFLLAIPEKEKKSPYVNMLSDLSTYFLADGFIEKLQNANTKEEMFEILSSIESKNNNLNKVNNPSKDIILCLTACATGIAHTYLAAKALEKAGEKLGVNIYVEKQGANGLEDEHTEELINESKGVIISADVDVQKLYRYNGKKYVKTRVAEPLKNSENLINKLLNNPDGIIDVSNVKEENSDKKEKNNEWSIIVQAIMTGISYMIPVIVAGGLLMGIPKLLALPFGDMDIYGSTEYFSKHQGAYFKFIFEMDKFGYYTYQFMYPVFTAYIAKSIAGKPGIVGGIVGGSVAGGLYNVFFGIQNGTTSGFFGAIIFGLVSGYTTKWLAEKIKVNKSIEAMKSMLIIPGLTILAIFLINIVFVLPVFGGFNLWMKTIVTASAQNGQLFIGAVIAACMAFDLGGPVNKAAMTVALGLSADKIIPLTASNLAVVIPPIGLGLATILDKKILKKKLYDDELNANGKTSIILGLIAISEGAIPFALKNPLIVIPINMIGTVLGVLVAIGLGAEAWLPLPAIWGWPLVNKNLWAYLLGMFVGVMFIALSNIFLMNHKSKKHK